jgi:adenosylcobinamide-GDP ribazoletransferase
MREALSFLTPLAGARSPSPSAVRWFPAVGLAIGGTVGLTWWLAAKAWPVAVAAAIVVLADLALTGLLHVDGLADAADGLLPHLPSPDRRLAVMADPHIGAYGAVAVATMLLARWAALASMKPSVLLVAALWCASRSAMAVTMSSVAYVGGGLATAFQLPHVEAGATSDGFRRWLPRVGVAGAVAVGAVGRGGAGVAAVAAALLAAIGVVALARRRVGGFTGDVLGAAGVVAETVGLVVAAAKW